LSERIREGDRLPNDATEAQLDGDAQPTPSKFVVSLENGVPEPSEVPCPIARRKGLVPSPAHPSNRLTAQLNSNWRVVDDPLQWILQRRKGKPAKRTRAGKTGPSAPLEKDCCVVFVNSVARSKTKAF
jgi:hypothetical protein